MYGLKGKFDVDRNLKENYNVHNCYITGKLILEARIMNYIIGEDRTQMKIESIDSADHVRLF